MNNSTLSKPESLELFHGSIGLNGEKIIINSGNGIGWNSLTLGDAFYTSMSATAARLFSHLILQKVKFRDEDINDNIGFAKIYQISLHKGAKILDADKGLDASDALRILSEAGIPHRYLSHRHDDQLTDFNKVADLLCYGGAFENNRNEYLTKALGFDGLMITERAWDSYDYYPQDIGVDWEILYGKELWPPKTIAVYNAESIAGFNLYQNGYLQEEEVELVNQEYISR